MNITVRKQIVRRGLKLRRERNTIKSSDIRVTKNTFPRFLPSRISGEQIQALLEETVSSKSQAKPRN